MNFDTVIYLAYNLAYFCACLVAVIQTFVTGSGHHVISCFETDEIRQRSTLHAVCH